MLMLKREAVDVAGKNNVMMNVNVIIAMLSILAETAMIVLRLFALEKSASLLAALFCC
jgi:hypothetical protein